MQHHEEGGVQQARSQATRSALIAAARALFVEKSYAGTGTPELVATAGVTRGALYHHFTDKQALFHAVAEAESKAVAEEIERGSPAGLSPRDALLRGGDAFLSAMSDPGRTRLLLLDAPAVLGRDALDAIDARHARRTLRAGLRAAIAAGAIRPLSLDILTQLLSAAYDRAALGIDRGDNREDWRAAIDALITGLAPCKARSDG